MDRRLRAGRRTNLALLVLLGSALGTGALAFANGGQWEFAELAAHGAAGLGIVLLSPWKSAISRRGVRRGRPGTQASVVLAALVVVTVATGVVHAGGVWPRLLGMQIHVAAALGSIPLAIVRMTAIHIVTMLTQMIQSPTTDARGRSARERARAWATVFSLPIHAAAST